MNSSLAPLLFSSPEGDRFQLAIKTFQFYCSFSVLQGATQGEAGLLLLVSIATTKIPTKHNSGALTATSGNPLRDMRIVSSVLKEIPLLAFRHDLNPVHPILQNEDAHYDCACLAIRAMCFLYSASDRSSPIQPLNRTVTCRVHSSESRTCASRSEQVHTLPFPLLHRSCSTEERLAPRCATVVDLYCSPNTKLSAIIIQCIVIR